MKKTITLFTALCLLITTATAQVVNIPDANFKAYLVGNTAINTNNDGEIQVSEATAYAGSISCSGLSISNLTGIESFTALTGLSCSNNQLTSLDVSQSTALVYLFCDNNQLTSLVVGQNTALTTLDCYVNQLTSLDVSQNTALTELAFFDNQLTSLNVANGNNTNFTFFSADGNPNLTCIQVDDAAFSAATWTGGDFAFDSGVSFSENCAPPCVVNIPDANFKSYLVGNAAINTNNDTEIQCSEAQAFNGSIVCGGLAISNLEGIEAFVNLNLLYCIDNQLTSLDLSQNTALTQLECNGNQLTSLDVSQNTDLTFLYCNDNQLTSLDFSQNTFLTQLECNGNQLTSLDVSQNTALTELECNGNQLTSLDVSQNTALILLYCSYNQLNSLNVANGNNSNFIEFFAEGNSNLTCIQVDDAAYSTTNWTGFNFSFDNGVTFSENCAPPCVVNIPDANFKSYLVGNSLINTNNDAEIQCSEAEAFNAAIDCRNQSIADLTGIEAFVNLTVLDCGNNQLTTLDVSQNTSLSHLGCEQNQISSLDVSQNTALTSLNLNTNNVASLDLSLNTALTELYCADNQLTGLDVSQNTALETLFCYENQLTGLDVSFNPELINFACNDNQLTELDVSQNTALEILYCYENQLTGLDVSFNPELINFACNDNQLTSLNVANGNNTNFTLLHANNNSALTCVEVDDASYSTANWPGGEFWFDAGVTFSEDCNPTPADNECDGANDINSLFGGVVNTPMTSNLYNNTGYTSNGDPTSGIECFSEGTPSLEATIWYTFIGDGNTYRIRTVDCSATNPHSDTQAALYSGDCNTLTPVACNDDEDAGNGEFNIQLDIETTTGTEYFLIIDGFNGSQGEFCLEVTRQGSSSIFEADYQTVRVYPNPTENLVSWNGITAQTVEVTDNTGRVVMNVTQPNGTVDISALKEGIYIMMLHTEEGVYTSRVVKQ